MKFIKTYNHFGFYDSFILWFTLSCDIRGFLFRHLCYKWSDLRNWGVVLYWYTKYQSTNRNRIWNGKQGNGTAAFLGKFSSKKVILNWLFQNIWILALAHAFFCIIKVSQGSIFCVLTRMLNYKLWCMPPVFTCSGVLKTSIVVLHFVKQMQQKNTPVPPQKTLLVFPRTDGNKRSVQHRNNWLADRMIYWFRIKVLGSVISTYWVEG